MIIISCLLCVIIFRVRQSPKETAHVPNKMANEMTPDIKMNTNPSYESNKQEQNQEDQYDYIAQDYLDARQDTIKVDTNLSYETVQCTNSDVAIQENPSYGTIQSIHDTTKPEYDVTI